MRDLLLETQERYIQAREDNLNPMGENEGTPCPKEMLAYLENPFNSFMPGFSSSKEAWDNMLRSAKVVQGRLI